MEYDSYTEDHRPSSLGSFQGHRLISDQIESDGLAVVWKTLGRVLDYGAVGDVVEFGCYVGTTSLFIRRLLNEHGQSGTRLFHVYDSFEGLPQKSAQDQSVIGAGFQAGKLYVGKKEFLNQFKRAGLRPPIIHKGWFSRLGPGDLPPEIAFAFLDSDFYDSILTSLNLVWPRMQSGGKILVDDYQREALPGVAAALEDFFRDKPTPKLRRQSGVAVIDL